ncbi:aspartate--tRNA(Asn) ligase, partial [Casaltella massiliensis]|nr:aspartate--tRNA(Asn) ligase [Casaltella massiliensis]
VYRAEQHDTNRHLNEYVSMDLEFGFIENEEDIMKLEEELLKFIINKLEKETKKYLNVLNVELPNINGSIPRIKFSKAIELLKEEYNKTNLENDLDPEAEKLLCEYAKEKL